MTDETKTCPYCGEEILTIAKKCKHCGEFLDGSIKTVNTSTSSNKFDNVDVDDKWKERFAIIDQFTINGAWWKINPEMWKIPLGQRMKLTFKTYTLGMLLGVFYYLFKGMWLKGLIYLVISVATNGAASALFLLAPYDYYRLKVLGKQW